MRVRFGAVLPFVCVLIAPAYAQAQQRAVLFADNSNTVTAQTVRAVAPFQQQEQAQEEMKPDEQMSTSGFFLGIIGMLGGAAVGSQIGQGDCPPRAEDKECMGRHAYTGALIAGTLFVPLGVHLANTDRRNLPIAMAASILTGAVIYYSMKAIPGEPIAMAPFLAAPVQVVTSVKLEKRK